MSQFEYIAVPAPRKSKAPRKVKGPEAKFAATVTDVMNEMAADGWEYQRAETLPCEERQGFTGKTVKYHSVLIFRRATVAGDAPVAAAAPAVVEPVFEAPSAPDPDLRDEPALTRATSDGPADEEFLQDGAAETETDTDTDTDTEKSAAS